MIQRRQGKTSSLAIWLPRLVSLALFVVSLGFLRHTSLEPVVLGKYDAPYVVFLALQFLVILPAMHCLIRFCAVEQALKFRSGRTFVVRPWQKIAMVLVGGWLVSQGWGAVADHWARGRVITFNNDMYHPYLQNTPIPQDAAQHVNRWGFRGDDLDREKADDVFRIFMFGGSTVYCGTVPYEQTHCRLLEQRLQEAYPQHRVEVQNLGTDWHSTEHDTIKLLFFAQDFAPDLVITFHGINDLVRSFNSDMFADGPYWSDYRHYLGATAGLAARGRKAPLFIDGVAGHWCSDVRFDQIRIDGPEGKGVSGLRGYFVPKTYPVDVTQWKSLPAYERNLRDFVAIARTKGMHVLLATQPALYRDDLTPAERQLLAFPLSHHFRGERASLHSMVEGMRRFNDSTRSLAGQTDVDLVDLERLMPKTTAYLYDDVHYTKAGNELVGAAFADKIIASKIIDRVMDQRRKGTDSARDSGQESATGADGR
ncbi:MAG TPA: SGNH/GDSL hydrolase family protein [Pirellulales bacterium]|jgi:hypothetical protein|nr:SGNH/GDSL hydrolase family protein [Pirellulales bacterium]